MQRLLPMQKRLRSMLLAMSAFTPLKVVSTSGLTAMAGRGKTAISKALSAAMLGLKYTNAIMQDTITAFGLPFHSNAPLSRVYNIKGINNIKKYNI